MAKTNKLYLNIADELRFEIAEGIFEINTFLPSERELSAKYDVERLTVRRALKTLEDEGLVQKLPGKGTVVKHKPVIEAGQATPDKNLLFAIAAGDGEKMKQPYMANLFYRLEKLCFQEGFNLQYTQIGPRGSLADFSKTLGSVSGIIFYSKVDTRFVETAVNSKIPTLLVSNKVGKVPAIIYDNINGCYDAVSHLIDKGCKRIVFISGAESYLNSKQRLEGYKRALATGGIAYDDELVITGKWDFESGYDCIERLLEKGTAFDGIMGANDMMALGAIRALAKNGLNVPKDIKVVGFDNIESGEFSVPSLSTVAVDSMTVAWVAMTMLKLIMNGETLPESLMIPSQLIIRESSNDSDNE